MKVQFHKLWLVTISLLAVATVQAGEFRYSVANVAGAPGTDANPEFSIQFVGDGATVLSQADFTFDPLRFTATVAPTNGALCNQPQSGRIRVIAPIFGGMPPPVPTDWCTVRLSINLATANGSFNFSNDPASNVCGNASGNSVSPCSGPVGIGFIRVGPLAPPATANYTPASGAQLLLTAGSGAVQVNYIAGGAGGSLQIDSCALSAITGTTFSNPILTPSPMSFAGNSAASGSIALTCAVPSSGGTALLSCMETVYPAAPQARTWNVVCPNTIVAPTVVYSPSVGVAVTSAQPGVIDQPFRLSINVNIQTNGAGSGPDATTLVNQCAASNGWIAETVPSTGVTAVGPAGASGLIDIFCLAQASVTIGDVTCTQTRAGATSQVNWPVHCPQGQPDQIFASRFE